MSSCPYYYSGGPVTESNSGITSATFVLGNFKAQSNGTITILATWNGGGKVIAVINQQNIQLTNGQPYTINVNSGTTIQLQLIVYGLSSVTASWSICSTTSLTAPPPPSNLETYILIVLILIILGLVTYAFIKYALPEITRQTGQMFSTAAPYVLPLLVE